MAHTITANNGSGTATPAAIEGYAPSRESRNVFYDLLDGTLGVSYIAPRPRAGTLRLLFTTKAAAFAAYWLHSLETAFTLASTDVTEIGMTYALDGSLDLDPKPDTGEWWVVVGYQELL